MNSKGRKKVASKACKSCILTYFRLEQERTLTALDTLQSKGGLHSSVTSVKSPDRLGCPGGHEGRFSRAEPYRVAKHRQKLRKERTDKLRSSASLGPIYVISKTLGFKQMSSTALLRLTFLRESEHNSPRQNSHLGQLNKKKIKKMPK